MKRELKPNEIDGEQGCFWFIIGFIVYLALIIFY